MVPEKNNYNIFIFSTCDSHIVNAEEEFEVEEEGAEVNAVELFEPWQESFEEDYYKYCDGIAQACDQYILDFYANDYPNSANPVLRKGCPYPIYRRLYELEENYNASALTVDPDYLIHMYGLYYVEKGGNSLHRYCLDCFKDKVSFDSDDVKVYEFHLVVNDAFEAHAEINYSTQNDNYWCHGCNCFLYEVESCIHNEPCHICFFDINKHSILDRVPIDIARRVTRNTFPNIDERWPRRM